MQYYQHVWCLASCLFVNWSLYKFLRDNHKIVPSTWWQNVLIQLYLMLVTCRENTEQRVCLAFISRTKAETRWALTCELFYKQWPPHDIFLSEWYLFTSALTQVNRSSTTYCSISPLLLAFENVMCNKYANDCSNFLSPY